MRGNGVVDRRTRWIDQLEQRVERVAAEMKRRAERDVAEKAWAEQEQTQEEDQWKTES